MKNGNLGLRSKAVQDDLVTKNRKKYGPIRRFLAAILAMWILGMAGAMFSLLFVPNLTTGGTWLAFMLALLMLPAAGKFIAIALRGA